MSVATGTRFGSYEVIAQIGAGGMGEVYEARDTKLGRNVAIKVLPEAFAHDSDRLARFQREARALASLNHPNIATIHGLEQSNGTNYLVMELVSGETLADRIKREGALPAEEALTIAKQIAEALEAAHEKGIIHRDLKPANVKVTPDGKVKVLDFGLAKAFAGDAQTNDLANSPTLSMAATTHGVILGTAAYMSPEQARGKAIDKRTDIWAFGCVLYEMLTAKRAFDGEDVTEILAAVVRAEPDWQALPPTTPVKIRDLLRRCLKKDRALRMRDAGDLGIEIVEGLAAPKEAGATPPLPASGGKLGWVVAVGLAIGVLALSVMLWRSSRSVVQPLVNLDVDLGPDVSLDSLYGAGVIISPDGTRLVYVSHGRLFSRRLDQPVATELSGTDGAFAPFFSPDGQWVAFFTGGRLKKVSVEGGAVIDLCGASLPRGGGSWGDDGQIIAALLGGGGLFRIPAAGGEAVPATKLAEGEAVQRWPQVLPGAKTILFTSNVRASGFDTANIEVASLTDGRRKVLVHGGTYGRYLPIGQLVYISRGTLFAVPFDLKSLELRGMPVPVLDRVGYDPLDGSAQFDFSQKGTLVYRNVGVESGMTTVQWLDGTGKTKALLAKPGHYSRPRLSPDGQRLALLIADPSSFDLWSYDWQRDNMTRMTFGNYGEVPGATWTPDSRYIAFGVGTGIYYIRADGAGQPELLTVSKNRQSTWSFSPDGKRLAYMELNPSTGFWNLWTVPIETGLGMRAGKPERFLESKYDQRHPSFSPDGKWLAYSSNESGSYQVYVRAFPDNGSRWQISNSGGVYPLWSPNGHELFFRSEDSRTIFVAGFTEKEDSFVADKPRVWSDKPLADFGINLNLDLAPDGKRMAVILPVEDPETQTAHNHVMFLENFFDEVRRRTAAQAK